MADLLLNALAVLNWWSDLGPADDEGLVFEEAPANDLMSLGIRKI